MSNNITKTYKLLADSFNTYLVTVIETMNHDTKNLTTKYATKYLVEVMLRNSPDIILMPTTAAEIENII
jgi:hypothetical protein